jgi:hypothetical protein
MPARLAVILGEIAALRASWGSVRGGWAAARQDARELLTHRRVLVDTQAMAGGEMQVVLRTRIRLNGDTQTDVLRGWFAATPAEARDATVAAHFASVTAATGGWAAALGMERLGTRLTMAFGALVALGTVLWQAITTEPLVLLHALLTDVPFMLGVGMTVLGVVVRSVLRWRLRALFRRGLGGPEAS